VSLCKNLSQYDTAMSLLFVKESLSLYFTSYFRKYEGTCTVFKNDINLTGACRPNTARKALLNCSKRNSLWPDMLASALLRVDFSQVSLAVNMSQSLSATNSLI
jgi:hypothetical protein